MAILLPDYLPNFDSLRNRSAANKKTKVKSETKETIDHFKLSCYASAAAVGSILLIDIFDVFKFSSQQLSLLGVTVALVLIPYAAKLKVLGVEFERPKSNEKP